MLMEMKFIFAEIRQPISNDLNCIGRYSEDNCCPRWPEFAENEMGNKPSLNLFELQFPTTAKNGF